MMPDDSVNLPDHLIGDSWSFEFDFAEYPSTYLDGLTAATLTWQAPGDEEPAKVVSLGDGLTKTGQVIAVDKFAADEFEEKTYKVDFRLWWGADDRRTLARTEQRFFL